MNENENTNQLTEERLLELINTSVNKAVSGMAARQEREFKSLVNPLAEQLAGLKQPTAEATEATLSNTINPEIAKLKKQVDDLTAKEAAAQAKAEAAERNNALSKVLNTFTFANDTARETAFDVFSSKIQQSEDGQYLIADEPLDVAVRSRMAALPGLQAPKAVGGSGATSTTSTTSDPLSYRKDMTAAEKQDLALKALADLRR